MNNGFSLLELLIVLAIIGILSAIAYPGYRDHIIRAHRSDGQTALLALANRMESYFFEHNTYQTATIATGKTTDVLNNNHSTAGWYSLSIIQATDSEYVLQATPLNAQAMNDIHCQSLIFTSRGEKNMTSGPAGKPTAATITECW